MNRTAKLFWAIVAAQAVFLLAWAGFHEVVRRQAPVIVLQARPVDPQDLLRGDYMTLRYDIGEATIDSATTQTGTNTDRGNEVWVLLEPRERYHVVAQASRERLMPKPSQVLVRGTLGYSGSGARRSSRIDYGIERYFVPEGKGAPHFQLMEIEVSVSPDHRLYIKRMLLDGHAYP